MQISRSEQKRRMQDFERLVSELIVLPSRLLARAPCDEGIRQHLLAASPLKGSVRQRQVKYLTKLLIREELIEAMYAFASQHSGKDLAAKGRSRSMEQWRNALIDEALAREEAWQKDNSVDWGESWQSEITQELAQDLPKLDQRNLARLSYRFVQTRDPRYSKEIFRYLRSAQELQQRASRRQETLTDKGADTPSVAEEDE